MAKSLKKYSVFSIHGGPGSGKGTCARKLASHYDLTYLSTGDLLRKVVKEQTEKMQKIRASIEKGELVETPLVLQLLKENMTKEAATSKGFVLDGYPRNVAQYTAFEKEIAPIRKAVVLNASDETMKARSLERAVTEGRSDDTEEVIAARIAIYNSNLKPLTDHLKKKKKLTEINADGEADEVFVQCKAAIEKKK